MICFRDRTFCSAECGNKECSRLWTPELQAAAEKWWGEPNAPVAFSDFGNQCGAHIPARTELEAAQ